MDEQGNIYNQPESAPFEPGGTDWSGARNAPPQPPYTPPQPPYASQPPQADSQPPQADSPQNTRSNRILPKVLLACGTALLVLSVAFSLAVVLGFRSCVASLSDAPIQDTAATKAFLADTNATWRDMEVLDALSGKINSLYDTRKRGSSAPPGSYLSYEEIRSALEKGSWPGDYCGYWESSSPQLWVRLAQLAQDYLEEKTGETWTVVDFTYPFPDNGPIPVPPTRDEDDSVGTMLVCTSGQDEGIYVAVKYWRWARPAHYTDNLDEVREQLAEQQQALDAFDADTVLGDRTYVYESGYSNADLFVWAEDENDPLLDGAAFAQVATACQAVLGDYGELVLLSPDTPAMIEFQPAGEYRNWKAPHEVSRSDAQSIIFNSLGKWRFVYAPADALRTAKNKSDGLEYGGMRANAEPYEPPLWTWTSPGEDSAPDEALARIVQEQLALDAEQLIALSSFEEEDDDNLVVHAHVVLPWGTVPEGSHEFCALLEELRERVWDHILEDHPGYEHRSLGLLVYVVDAEDIPRAYDETATFEDMRLAALEDPRLLAEFSPTIQLVARPYISQTEGGTPYLSDTEKNDVYGEATLTREWAFG